MQFDFHAIPGQQGQRYPFLDRAGHIYRLNLVRTLQLRMKLH